VRPAAFDAVLFDLDGTLADTAPDLVVAANRLRARMQLPATEPARIRPVVSKGGMAILRAAFPERGGQVEDLLQDFLDIYHADISAHTRLFDGVADMLERIERAGMRWGVVTNKVTWLTEPLLRALALDARVGCVVCGDTLPVKKPDPAPVLLACERLRVSPARTVFVGDDDRDIYAARAAGVRSAWVSWGYCEDRAEAARWGADHVLDAPAQLFDVIGRHAHA
jgi:phosphoglycolate phosphatase